MNTEMKTKKTEKDRYETTRKKSKHSIPLLVPRNVSILSHGQ